MLKLTDEQKIQLEATEAFRAFYNEKTRIIAWLLVGGILLAAVFSICINNIMALFIGIAVLPAIYLSYVYSLRVKIKQDFGLTNFWFFPENVIYKHTSKILIKRDWDEPHDWWNGDENRAKIAERLTEIIFSEGNIHPESKIYPDDDLNVLSIVNNPEENAYIYWEIENNFDIKIDKDFFANKTFGELVEYISEHGKITESPVISRDCRNLWVINISCLLIYGVNASIVERGVSFYYPLVAFIISSLYILYIRYRAKFPLPIFSAVANLNMGLLYFVASWMAKSAWSSIIVAVAVFLFIQSFNYRYLKYNDIAGFRLPWVKKDIWRKTHYFASFMMKITAVVMLISGLIFELPLKIWISAILLITMCLIIIIYSIWISQNYKKYPNKD